VTKLIVEPPEKLPRLVRQLDRSASGDPARITAVFAYSSPLVI
jgi:hypothetical protein